MGRLKGSKNKKRNTIQAESKTVADLFHVTLKSFGRIYKSEGKTFEEAVDKIKISGGARSTSIIVVEKDDYKKERILNGSQTNGLFGQGSPTTKLIYLKGVRAILGV